MNELEEMMKNAGVELTEAYSQQVLTNKLINSMRLFLKKADAGGALFVNGELPPILKKQMKSILVQARNIEL